MHGTVEEASAVLGDPCSNYLEYGYDNMIKGEGANTTGDGALLKKLCVAVGADRAKNPESPTPNTLRYRFGVWRREVLDGPRATLDRLEEALGPIDFPNPYPTESGTATPRGIASVRAVHAIYYASRLKGKVVEIGGGLGAMRITRRVSASGITRSSTCRLRLSRRDTF